MFTVEELYTNDEYIDFLIVLTRKRMIDEFDDFRQDVFLYMLEDGASTFSMKNAKLIADKVAQRTKRKQIRSAHYSLIDNIDYDDDYASVLWEDRNIV